MLPYALPLMRSWCPKGPLSPLTSALRHYRRNACPSRRLPTPGRCQSVPNATSRIQLQLCDVRSRCASPPYSTDVHAAPNLGQIEKINDMFDAVGLGVPPGVPRVFSFSLKRKTAAGASAQPQRLDLVGPSRRHSMG